MPKGGLTYGPSHEKGGIPMKVSSTGQSVELEGGEGVINKRSMADPDLHTFKGKKMSNCQIVSAINEEHGGRKMNCDDAAVGGASRMADGGYIGRKTKILMKEGYPQKQALAIAYDMERRKMQDGGSVKFDTKRITGEANIHKNNTHFVVHKPTNSIAEAYDYRDVDPEELRDSKDDYFFIDIEENFAPDMTKFRKGDFAVVKKSGLAKRGIDLNDYKIFQGEKFKHGGRMKQGYNARLDESLGMRNRGRKGQGMKARRDESKGMERSMGRRPYQSVRSMDRMEHGGEIYKNEEIAKDLLRNAAVKLGLNPSEGLRVSQREKDDIEFQIQMGKLFIAEQMADGAVSRMIERREEFRFEHGGRAAMSDDRIVLGEYRGRGDNEKMTYQLVKDEGTYPAMFSLVEMPSGNVVAKSNNLMEVQSYIGLFTQQNPLQMGNGGKINMAEEVMKYLLAKAQDKYGLGIGQSFNAHPDDKAEILKRIQQGRLYAAEERADRAMQYIKNRRAGFVGFTKISGPRFGHGGMTYGRGGSVGYDIVDFKKYDKADIADVELDLIPSRTGSDGYEGDVTFIFVDKPEKTFSGGHGANDYMEDYGIRLHRSSMAHGGDVHSGMKRVYSRSKKTAMRKMQDGGYVEDFVAKFTGDEKEEAKRIFDEYDHIPAQVIVDHLENVGVDTVPDEWEEAMDAYYGNYDDFTDYARNFVQDVGFDGINNRGYYFDFEKFGRDIRLEGSHTNHLEEDLEYELEASPLDRDQITFLREEIERVESLSDREIGEEAVFQVGGISQIGERNQENYFDYEAFGNDLAYDLYYYKDPADRSLHLFLAQ